MLMPGILGRIVGFGLQLQNVAIPEKCRGCTTPPSGVSTFGGVSIKMWGGKHPPRGGVKISLGRTWALPRTSLSNDGHGSAACDAGRANYIALCLTCAMCNETESINQMTVV